MLAPRETQAQPAYIEKRPSKIMPANAPTTNAIATHRFSRGRFLGSPSMWMDGSPCGNIVAERVPPGVERLLSVNDSDSRRETPEDGLGIGGILHLRERDSEKIFFNNVLVIHRAQPESLSAGISRAAGIEFCGAGAVSRWRCRAKDIPDRSTGRGRPCRRRSLAGCVQVPGRPSRSLPFPSRRC
jgi:hypothetical protein